MPVPLPLTSVCRKTCGGVGGVWDEIGLHKDCKDPLYYGEHLFTPLMEETFSVFGEVPGEVLDLVDVQQEDFFKRCTLNFFSFSGYKVDWYLPVYKNLFKQRYGTSRTKFKRLSLAGRLNIVRGVPLKVKVPVSKEMDELLLGKFFSNNVIYDGGTYWFHRLKYLNKLKAYDLLRYPSKFKQYSMTTDGVILSLLGSFPWLLYTYKDTDNIINSVFSNLLNQGESYMIKLKRFRKALKKWYFDPSVKSLVIPREFSFYRKFISYLTRNNSPFEVFQVSMLCQTRSAGTAGSKVEDKSYNTFNQMVSQPSNYTEADVVEIAGLIDRYLSQIDCTRVHSNPRISLGTSSCLEFTHSVGGKWKIFPYLDEISQDDMGSTIKAYDLNSGELTDNVLEWDLIATKGEYLFHKALHLVEINYDPIWKCRASFIHEPGPKARLITAGSVWHAIALHPFGKVTVSLLSSIPDSRSGLKKTKDLWNLYKDFNKLSPSELSTLSGLSFDAEASTDNGDFIFADLCIQWFIEKGFIPFWYGTHIVKRLLCASRTVTFTNKKFLEILTKRGWLMGDPGVKTILTIATGCISAGIGLVRSNKGDDVGIAIQSDSDYKEFRRRCLLIDLKISEDDTFHNRHWINYSEEYLKIPNYKYETEFSTRKLGCDSFKGYLDYPRLRLVLDVRKENQDHSSVPTGKYELLGKELSWISRDNIAYGTYQLMSYFQDFFLSYEKTKGIIYFPRQLGGLGKPAPWGNASYTFYYCARMRCLNALQLVLNILKAPTDSVRGAIDNRRISVLQTRHLSLERDISYISDSNIREIRTTFSPVAQPVVNSNYDSECKILCSENILIKEVDLVNRWTYLQYIRELCSGEASSVQELVGIEDLVSSYLDLLSNLQLVNYPITERRIQLLSDLPYVMTHCSTMFRNTYYFVDEEVKTLDDFDPLRITPWREIVNYERPRSLGTLIQDITEYKDIFDKTDVTPNTGLHPKGILLGRIDCDNVILAYAKSLKNPTLFVVITEDKKLMRSIAICCPHHILFMYPSSYLDKNWGLCVKAIYFRYPELKLLPREVYMDDGNVIHIFEKSFSMRTYSGRRDYYIADMGAPPDTTIFKSSPPPGWPDAYRITPSGPSRFGVHSNLR